MDDLYRVVGMNCWAFLGLIALGFFMLGFSSGRIYGLLEMKKIYKPLLDKLRIS